MNLPINPQEIEARSLSLIRPLLESRGFTDLEREVVARVVHATGDPSLAGEIVLKPGAAEKALSALTPGSLVVCDVEMLKVAVRRTLERLGVECLCAISAPGAAEEAARRGITRAAAGMEILAPRLDNSLVAVGNAPTALFRLLDLHNRGRAKPAAVLGLPVGFVGAAEAKQALLESDLPAITLPGTRGGSPAAAAALNALSLIALDAL